MANEMEVINFTNIDRKEFKGMFGGVEYVLKAGETKPYPKYLAEHLAKQVAERVLIDSNGDWSRESKEKEGLIKQALGNVVVPAEVVSEVATAPEPEFPDLKVAEEPPQEPAEVQTEEKVKRGRKKKVA